MLARNNHFLQGGLCAKYTIPTLRPKTIKTSHQHISHSASRSPDLSCIRAFYSTDLILQPPCNFHRETVLIYLVRCRLCPLLNGTIKQDEVNNATFMGAPPTLG